MKTQLSLFFALLLFLTGCASTSSPKLPRPFPGYAHWLEKQSMINQAPKIIAQVSQSELIWLQGSDPGRARLMLETAPSWLDSRLAFRELAQDTPKIAGLGISGIYMGHMGELPDIWLSASANTAPTAPASLNFNPGLGTEENFENLVKTAENNGLELGGALLAGYTGRGPDFALQARKVTGYAGLYAMLPVPAEAEQLLPPHAKDQDEWQATRLGKKEVTALTEAGVLPVSIARDNISWASPGGWASTGPITGADGSTRRWVYRYAYTPEQPVMAWQDPSGQAAKIFSAAIIRHTGLLGISLAGIHMEPLMGLEPGQSGDSALSPGIDAINDIARQIHRYGGWAMQADAMPAYAIEQILKGQCDFCRDDLTETLAVYGLLYADGRPLAQLYRNWLKNRLDTGRLARGPIENFNIKLLPGGQEYALPQDKLSAFEALGNVGKIQASRPELKDALKQFLTGFRAGLPGLAFFEQSELNGLEKLLATRKKAGLAAGRVLSVTRGKGGGFAILSSLPKNAYWLLICNFGINPDEIAVDLPAAPRRAVEANGSDLTPKLSGKSFRLGLNGRTIKNIILN